MEPFARDEFYAICMLYHNDKMCSCKFFLKKRYLRGTITFCHHLCRRRATKAF